MRRFGRKQNKNQMEKRFSPGIAVHIALIKLKIDKYFSFKHRVLDPGNERGAKENDLRAPLKTEAYKKNVLNEKKGKKRISGRKGQIRMCGCEKNQMGK